MSERVPEGWVRGVLGDFLAPLPKSGLPSGVSDTSGYYNFYVCSPEIQKSFHCEANTPAILLSTGGEAAVHYASGKYSYSADVWAIHFKGDICNAYAYRCLTHNIEKINYAGFQGSSIKHLDKHWLRKLKILIPPLPEQKKIAAILTSVDKTIENTQKQIAKLQDLKTATMNELLTKGIGHTKFKDSELGRIPEGWRLVKLKDISTYTRGLTYASSDYADADNGLPFLTLKSISKEGGYSPEGLKYFRGTYKKHHVLSTGDVLFANTDLTRDGDVVGSPLYFDGNDFSQTVLYSMDLSKLQVDPRKIDSKYLYFLLMTHNTKRHMINSSAGSTVLHLDTERAVELKFNLPPLIEQKKIACILTSIDDDIEQKQRKFYKTQTLKKSLMWNLLTDRIRI